MLSFFWNPCFITTTTFIFLKQWSTQVGSRRRQYLHVHVWQQWQQQQQWQQWQRVARKQSLAKTVERPVEIIGGDVSNEGACIIVLLYYCTCWWYSWCHFPGKDNTCSDHFDGWISTNMHCSILIVWLNSRTSRIKTNAFFNVIDSRPPLLLSNAAVPSTCGKRRQKPRGTFDARSTQSEPQPR